MLRRLSTGLILGCALAGPPADARTTEEGRSGDWAIAAQSDDQTGAFLDCSARTELRDGVGLALVVDGRAQWSLGFTGNLGGSPGRAYPVRFRVDRGRTRSGVATVDQGNVARIMLDDPQTFLDEVRRGSTLSADAGVERLTFSLRDTRAVLGELAGCAERRTRTAAAAASPQMAAEPQANRATPAPDAERRLEAMTVAVNILSRAKITGFELQPAQVPAQFQGHEVVWQSGDLTGSLRILPQSTAADLGATRSDLVSTDIKACKGRFTAEANSGPDGTSATLTTVCLGEKGLAADYLATARALGGAYVLSVIGPPDKTEVVKAAGASLRDPAVQITSRKR